MEKNHFPGGDNASVNERMLDKALGYLHACKKSHPKCYPQNPSFRPTRLLDLGNPDTQIKLVVFDSNSSGPDLIKYACLSHRWGNIEAPCLTVRKTLAENMAGIAWSKIPKTSQDAIIFTRRLGIQYLWIDSLCIIQKDEADWLQEGAMMADIYSNSSITIAATCANNCNEGLHARGDPPTGDHLCDWLKYDTNWHTHHRPLTSRAWYFQEQSLSPRVIHFYYDRLLWKCRCAMGCPCKGLQRLESYSAFAQCDDMTDDQLWSHWPRIASPYSACHLTRDSDRLAAISGVAKASGYLQRNFKYVAGLWMKDSGIPLSLDWRTWGSRVERRHTPGEWAAPSWSWASVIPSPWDGNIVNEWPSTVHPESKPEFRIEEYKLNFKNPEDETGPLKQEGTSITITGSAVKGTLLYDDNWPEPWKPGIYDVALRDNKGIGGRFQADFRISDESLEGHLKPGSPIVLFWLFTAPSSEDVPTAIFLVLSQKVHEAGRTEFERIARFDMSPDQFNSIKDLLVKESTFCLV